MSVKTVALRQYRSIIDQARRAQSAAPRMPREGWVKTVRKGLGMTAAALARRLGYTRSRIAQIERAEMVGGVTLRTMEKMASAMGCRFVYSIIPDRPVAQVIESRARAIAAAQMKLADVHMALEGQSLTPDASAFEFNRLVSQILARPGTEFWDDEFMPKQFL